MGDNSRRCGGCLEWRIHGDCDKFRQILEAMSGLSVGNQTLFILFLMLKIRVRV